MAEETEKTQSQQEQTESQAASETETPGTEKGQEAPNYEQQYKDTQAELTKAATKAAEAEQLIELISPHVDWGKVQGGGEKPAEEEGEGFVDRRTHAEELRKLSDNVDNKLLTLEFRQAHPELRPYEDTITAPALARLRQQHPRESIKKVMERAAEFTAKLLEDERGKGREEAEKKAQEAAGAEGLGSTGTTSSKKEEKPVGESGEDYVARRKAQSRKSRGLT